MRNKQKGLPREAVAKWGFTVIELLVVIAIIGILASIILVILQNSRDKARDARIKSNIGQMRTLAEYINNSAGLSYLDVAPCFTNPTPDLSDFCWGIGNHVKVLQADTLATGGQITSVSTNTTYCVQSKLKTNAAQYFCADSTGTASVVGGVCEASGLCPGSSNPAPSFSNPAPSVSNPLPTTGMGT